MKLKPKQNKRCFTVVNSSDRTHTQHIEMRPQLFKTGGRQMWALQKHKWLHLLSSFVFYLLHYKVKKDLGYCMNSSSIYKSSWFIGSEWFSSCCFFDLCKPHRMAVKLGCCHDKIENTNIRFLTQPFTLTSVKNTELSLTEPIGAHNASKPHSSAEVKADIWLDDLPKQQTFFFPASHRWSLTRVLLELLWCCRFHLMTWDHRECKCHAVLWFFFSGRLLVGTFVALFFNLLTLLSVKNKPFVFVSEGKITPGDSSIEQVQCDNTTPWCSLISQSYLRCERHKIQRSIIIHTIRSYSDSHSQHICPGINMIWPLIWSKRCCCLVSQLQW